MHPVTTPATAVYPQRKSMYAPTPISGNRSGHTLPVSAVPMHKTPYRTLLDALPAGILQIAPDESVRFANARFAGMLGYTPDTFPAYLCELIIEGIETNINDELAIINDPRFISGDYDTAFMEER